MKTETTRTIIAGVLNVEFVLVEILFGLLTQQGHRTLIEIGFREDGRAGIRL